VPSASVSLLAAEIVLVTAAVLVYLGSTVLRSPKLWRWIALGAVLLAAAALATCSRKAAAELPPDASALAAYARWLALGAGALFVLLAWRPLAGPGTPEYLGSLLLIVAGVMLVAVARDLVLLFVSLELVSIPTYIVLYLGRRGAASQEATTKYFFLSVFASAILLYGFSFLYGATGSAELDVIQERLAQGAVAAGSFGSLAKVAVVLIFAGLGFRIAAVPFHFYAPDVFQGTSNANAGLLSVAPKIAGLVALVRVVAVAMPGAAAYAWPVAMVLAAVTMTVGNVMALWQENLRRLLAYSSIANAGYMLIGLCVYLAFRGEGAQRWDGVGALLFYLLTYAVATIGTFAAIASLGRGEEELEGVEELAGLAWIEGRIRPILAWLIAIFMFSLAGVPPLAGFWGKLAIFASSLSFGDREHPAIEPWAQPWFVALAAIGLVNSAIAAAYYLRIVGVMFFRLPLGTPRTTEGARGTLVATFVCAALVVVMGVGFGPWLEAARRASPRVAAAAAQAASAQEGAGLSVANGSHFDYPEGE